MQHWLTMRDYNPRELAELVALARALKDGGARDQAAVLKGKIFAMIFFNPSLRTRASCEAAMARFGGSAITLSVGGDTWQLEHRDGVIMNGGAAEHVKEAAPVMSRYCDALGVRTFAALQDPDEDARETVIRSFARYATVPVVNLESASEHPCQGLADWMTIEEKLGGARGKRIVVTWAPQAKATPMAVPHSAILSAAAAGMDVTVAHPEGYELNAAVLDHARNWCAAFGSNFRITHEQREACAHADVVYVKSWGSQLYYGRPGEQQESFQVHRDWMVEAGHLPRRSILMHCLPVRRNVVIADSALDDARSVVVDQAENRLWTEAAILIRLLHNKK